jgi:hypothetical protein
VIQQDGGGTSDADSGAPPAAGKGGTTGRGGRPGWDDTGGVDGGQTSGGSGSDAGSDPDSSAGGSSGAGGSPGAGGISGQGGSPGNSGTGGFEIPGNNSTGTGGTPAMEKPFVPPVAADTCDAAITIPMNRPHMDLPVSTTAAKHDMSSPCAPNGNDVFFKFSLASREAVYADTFGSTWDTVVFFAKACDGSPANFGGAGACNDNACGTMQSQAVAVLLPGIYYLVVSGATGQAGDTTVHFEHALIGNGPVDVLGPGMSVLKGTTAGGGNLTFCEAAAAENSYWWPTCPDFAGGSFTAATCGGTAFDSVVSLQIPKTGAAICNDDACGFQSRVTAAVPAGAGLHVLSVDGSTGRQAGAYSMTVTRP